MFIDIRLRETQELESMVYMFVNLMIVTNFDVMK